ncbi:hypothetical protein NM688_g9101 [Phlebia brevispora]|uniref:Uncharacterized protein n=1 Tax=Phlebia brevispora TaxID=194682 RepID=A0ACC1RMX8_9APHY|nr:hypothetical protein NM688_g9101 [Phlebia brevispora]
MVPDPSTPRSRTPSPDRSSVAHSQPYRSYNHDYSQDVLQQAVDKIRLNDGIPPDSDDDHDPPVHPSAKALGKRRAVEDMDSNFDPNDMFYEHSNHSRRSDDLLSESSEESPQPPWHHPTHYVYDAAAERMQELIREGRMAAHLVDEVH